MSIEVSVSDQAAFDAALADVRSDTSATNFMVCGHTGGKPNEIEVRSTGNDAADIATHVSDDEFLYIYARYVTTIDMSTCSKFVYITWIGETVPFVKKGRFGVVSGSVAGHFPGQNMTMDTSSREELDKDKIIAQLNTSSGTVSKVLENSEAASRQKRGFTQTQLPQKDTRRAFQVSAVASQGHAIEVLPEVTEAVAQVRSDSDEAMWTLVGYMDGSPKGPLKTVGSGTGDLSELKEHLTEDEAMYGLWKVVNTNSDDITSVKFIYIQWLGSKVKPMTKAKVSTHKGTATSIFEPAHLSIFATELSELSQTAILEKIKQQTS